MSKHKYYLLSSFTLLLILVIGLTFLLGSVSAEQASASYQGPEFCGGCHTEEYHEWNGTMHAQAFSDPIFQAVWNARGQPSYCLACHTTGYNETTGEYALEGVTCERCHGGPGAMEKTLSASLCGECHTGAHHPTFEEWNISAHSESYEDLEAIGQNTNERCLGCHSAEGALGKIMNISWSVENATNPITCAVCHDPMSLELRIEPSSALCGQCHGQYDLWSDNSPHGIMSVQCSDCHMYTREYISEEEPAITGHTFDIVKEEDKPLICQNCHGVIEGIPDYETAISVMLSIQSKIDGVIEDVRGLINEAESIINEASTIQGINTSAIEEATKLLEEASHDFEIDIERAYSRGFHNPTATMELINTIIEKVSMAKAIALKAKAEALMAQLTQTQAQLTETQAQLAETQNEINNLKSQVNSLNQQISNMEDRISELEAAAGMSYPYLIGGLIGGLILGAVVTYFIKRKP